jgi:hypothetical protein
MYDDVENRNPALNYTENAEGGFYTHYVDNSGDCSWSVEFGSLENPLCGVPGLLTEGMVVEVHGGPYSDNTGGTKRIMSYGSEAYPVFIRGYDSPPMFTRAIVLMATYTIVENLNLSAGLGLRAPSGYNFTEFDHVSIRDCESIGRGIGLGSSNNYSVVYNNHIHHGGSWDYEGENDVHGMGVGAFSHYNWFVDNHVHHMGGDSFQSGHGACRTMSHVYIGRNDMHHDGENAVDLKDLTDVIVSQNVMHDYYQPDNPSADNVITVSHYGASDPSCRGTIRAWFIYNEMYNSYSNANRVTSEAEDIYFIGNIVHDTEAAAFGGWSHGNVSYVGNTMYNVAGGIGDSSHRGDVAGVIVNNIFGSLTSGTHIGLTGASYLGNAIVLNNLFQDPMDVNTGCVDCIEGDPMFVGGGDYSLQAGSPAIDNGTVSEVYQKFYDLYGINISVDCVGAARPQGGGWDIGAYESG